jgi:lipid II:glycine glycyltransferase (peptidoglycan interpeptide bridge formation enzyme)
LKISKLNISSPIDEKSLFSLINQCDTSVFFSKEWIKVLYNENFEIIGIKNLNDELIGAFYLQKYKRKKIFTQISPPPLCPYNWLILNCDSETNFNKVSFYKKVFKEIVSYLESIKCDIYKINFPTSFQDLSPFVKNGFETKLKFTYVIDLNLSEEEILKNMSSERRRNIKKGLKSDLKIEANGNKQHLMDLVYKTIDRENLDLDKSFVKKVIFDFATEDNTFFQVAYQEGKPCAATFFVYDQHRSYYLLGGYDASFQNEFAGPMCMWNGILKAKSLGVSVFDFEGSMQPKIEKYFRGFGGSVEMIPMIYKSQTLSKFVKT